MYLFCILNAVAGFLRETLTVPRTPAGEHEPRDLQPPSYHSGYPAILMPRWRNPELIGCSAVVPEDGASVDDRALHPAADRPVVERGVLGFRAKFIGADIPGLVGVEQHEIGWCADGESADRQA